LFLLVTLNLTVVVDFNSILTQQMVKEHKRAPLATCSILIYGIPFVRIVVPRTTEGFSHYECHGDSPSAD
jgi:hypothetical protein